MTAHIYTEADAPIDPLKGKRIAVIGYGSQGHAHALNAHDSGLDVMVGLYQGSKSWAAAEKAGLHTEPAWNRGKILDELLTAFVEPKLIQPTFLTDYPTDFPGSTLAKGKPGHPEEVERFEAFAGGIEVANAFSELNDPRVQRERFMQQVRAREAGDAEAQPFDQDFLIALEHGMPPTGGLGVGIDRIAMLLTDQHTIRDVILFPQLRPRDDRAES